MRERTVRQPSDDYPEHIEAAVRSLVSGDRDAAAAAIEQIAFTQHSLVPRQEPSLRVYARVFHRDAFQCRYCGAKTIPTPVMRLLSTAFPAQFPYHRNWKQGSTHPAVITRSCSLDHLVPVARGGDPLDLDNLVTACWMCNVRKGDLFLDELGWSLMPPPEDVTWDGLVSLFQGLFSALSEPPPREYYRKWINAFKAASAAAD